MTTMRFSDSEIAAVYKVIAERRDMRHFLGQAVDPALLARLLHAAHQAPSVGLMQPWRFIRISNRALRAQIHELVEEERINTARALGEREDEFMKLKVEGVRECGELLVAGLMDRREAHVFGRRTLPEMDLASVACAIQNLWLAARAEGIGMGWVSLFDVEKLRVLLKMPTGSKPVAILCLGHVSAFYPKPMLEIERWTSGRKLSEALYENGWGEPGNIEAASIVKTLRSIPTVSEALSDELRHKIDNKTKPVGSLGRLEALALQIGRIQNTVTPRLTRPVLMVFAGDHGVASEGVSPYPQDVTRQMLLNFIDGGAAVNVLSRQSGFGLRIIDAGVNHDFGRRPELIDAKVAKGTRNFLREPAMTSVQCEMALERGATLAKREVENGSNVFAFGEMGIGNSSSATALMSALLALPVEACVGRGTGLNDAGLKRKQQVIEQALQLHSVGDDPLKALQTFGGFEIAMMAGAMLGAAAARSVLLIDGFIVTAALLVAARLSPAICDYCIFAHQSGEAGHAQLLKYFGAEPLLKLDMRLGEGTGAALAYPLLSAAVDLLNNMASFEAAGVSRKIEAE